ncbi:MCE family protein [Mycobacterium shinjukuense]|uniref:Putative Mce family protein n=1 Tax=Mycobacterium shinjukuense TaxID=398694 RepID=A0A7I7MXS4_9MYCO|nr:MlaD family protein [Mycobacterium shinjukuense]MCV6987515.1 MCE family protein [Mycobacterium shinjukuense]ORB69976.1 mammalian cell entry protein [Mycobacterium shinjukuense]BBX75959.1 putative Mce family protein [Mycobacterium shinjukuense]
MKFNAATTVVILVITTMLGVVYLSLSVLHLDPTEKATRLTLLLDNSGGLMPTSQVTMRGIRVGRVTGIRTTPTGLQVSIELDRAHPVPVDSVVSIQNLSLVGEQYIDFKPKRVVPPYFSDGAVIPADRVARAVTVSDLLARANALLAAINPTYVRTVVSNVSQALAGNDDALDSLATTAGLVAKMEWERRQLLATLFGNVATLTTDLDELHAGAVLGEAGNLLPGTVLALTGLVRDTDEYTRAAGDGAFAPGGPIPTLVANLGEYADMLSGPLSTFAAVLEPATAPLRGFMVDAGHWLDYWESTFNDAGGLRVQVNVPEWHQQ